MKGMWIPQSPLFPSCIEHSLYRWAHRFVRAMNTPNPAAGATLPFFQLAPYSSHMVMTCLCFLYGNSPTNPFIARKRRQTLPCRTCLSIDTQDLSHIRREGVYRAARNLWCSHRVRISLWLLPFYSRIPSRLTS